jgi:hypothetical protein
MQSCKLQVPCTAYRQSPQTWSSTLAACGARLYMPTAEPDDIYHPQIQIDQTAKHFIRPFLHPLLIARLRVSRQH